MTKPDLTFIAIILDRSGSMNRVRDATIAGINTFVDQQRGEPGEAVLSLVLFNDEVTPVFNAMALGQAPRMTHEVYVPKGGTALLDAIGQTIGQVGEQLGALPEAERPGKVLVCIMTDGQENASRRYTQPAIMEMINHQRDMYSWEFVFLGANQDAIAEGAKIGVHASASLSYTADAAGMGRVMETYSRAVKSYRSSAVGKKGAIAFTAADRHANSGTAAGHGASPSVPTPGDVTKR